MTLPHIGARELENILPVGGAIDALEAAFAAEHRPESPLRTHVDLPRGELLLMPASSQHGVGVKLITLAPENPGRGLPFLHSVYVLFSAESLEPKLTVDGAALTALRTSAVSALATRLLARPDSSRLVLFGAGVQANAHLDAMMAVRPVDRVRVVSRSGERAERLADRARKLNLDAAVDGPEAVSEADIVCTCTTSSTPVFDGKLLPDGVHLNAVGAYRPDSRELDDETIGRAKIVVETREAALAEAGDLLIPIAARLITPSAISADLSEVVRGANVRTSAADVTVFKSVGVAFEDLAVAAAVLQGQRR
jgi:ornithine cyclodeaminase/alanine dehydrogenase-like protein (mu-crystallin family)